MTPGPDGDGDCYQVAAQFVVFNASPVPGAMLCHGTCTGTGPIEGVAFGHAWVEIADGALVVERSNGHSAVISHDTYYTAGECRDVTRYTEAEARSMLARFKHYGPWPETENT